GIAKKYNLSITGLQQQIGSNALDAGILLKAARVLLKTAAQFEDVTHIDFGGGLGIPYAPSEKELDLKTFGAELKKYIHEFKKSRGKTVEFAMEPGRFLVAEAGTLIVSVTDIKQTTKHTFVGVDSGFNHLLRPALYASYHPIENLSRTRGKRGRFSVAGNVCESGDVFATDREMLAPDIGDVLAICNAGAYGFSMASTYNLRVLPKEILITKDGKLKNISFDSALFAR
ncbi:diaminopimelate decarboxylase, partial [Patescibacteria group bacterium]|nr:diaminopimelate decarboxylase [Patescibacteria group bacterium]